MHQIKLLAAAKINLALDVVGVRPDGYHLLSMIMQSVSLYDKICITRGGQGIRVLCGAPGVPEDERNIAYKAADIFLNNADIPGHERGVMIQIEKSIPSRAGLAGGSADGAAVLYGLDKLYGTKLDAGKLAALAQQTGADVPFCLTGGTALVQGIGEQITPLAPLKGCWFVICKPYAGAGTPEVFREYDRSPEAQRLPTEKIVQGICEGDNSVFSLCGNVLEGAAAQVCKDAGMIGAMKKRLTGLGAAAALMSGSGTCVYGVFLEEQAAVRAEAVCRECYPQVVLCTPVPSGVTRL